MPDPLEALVDELARLGVDLPVDARPLRFGSWIGGDRDGNPNVPPTTTLDVLALQHAHALRDALAVLDELRADLSSSVRIRASPRSSRPRWPRTSSACPRSSRATGGSTRRSPTG